tara:strand:- start:3568 stop:4551 length:984 start_codon:yes stop_codon:yes gene_type:complete
MKKFIRQVPKIELHSHFEGSFPKGHLYELYKKYGYSEDFSYFSNIFNTSNFESFIVAWELKNSLVREIDDLIFLTNGYVEYLKSQNIIHTDITISPFGFKNLNPEESIEEIYKVMKNSDINFSFIGDVVRNSGVEVANYKYNIYKNMREYNISAIGLGGSESKYPPELYVDLFKKVKQDSFKISIHAGEFGSEENIYNSIFLLGADRIGHGNNIKNSKLLNYIKDNNIHIETCPISNIKLGSINNILEHDFYSYFNQGLRISINSDDPGMFNKTLIDNYDLIIKNYKLSKKDIIQLQKNSIDDSFSSDDEKILLHKKLELFKEKRSI